jgi:hypothetical protein
MSTWKCVLELGSDRRIAGGSEAALAEAVRRGADLRIYTEFRHNEHLDTSSDNPEIVQEVSDFRVTYLLEDRWVAGIMNLRMPIDPPVGFGPRASMSFFLYNQNGQQSIARPHLDGIPAKGSRGPSPIAEHLDMPKYHQQDSWDTGTNAPSHNFIYDFEVFRYLVRDEWREVLAHTAHGKVTKGSIEELATAFESGCEIKVAIRGLCDDLGGGPGQAINHEVFVQTGPGYYSTERRIFAAGTQPVVRVKPAIPMLYGSGNWDFGWFMPRNDGFVAYWLCDPYTLAFRKAETQHAIRWFVR